MWKHCETSTRGPQLSCCDCSEITLCTLPQPSTQWSSKGNSRHEPDSVGEKPVCPQPQTDVPWRPAPWNSGSKVYWCFSRVLFTLRKCELRAKKKSLDLGDRDWALAMSLGILGSSHYLLVSVGFVISRKQVSQWVLPGSTEALGQVFRDCFWPEIDSRNLC